MTLNRETPPQFIEATSVTLELTPREAVMLRGILGMSEPANATQAFNHSAVSQLTSYTRVPDKLKTPMTLNDYHVLASGFTRAFDSVYQPK